MDKASTESHLSSESKEGPASTGAPISPPSSGSPLTYLWKSPWTFWIGFRYLKSKKDSQFLSFITVLSMIGICVGVTAMIVVMSVMDGFETEMRKRLMANDLHVLITPSPKVKGFDRGFVPSSALPQETIRGLTENDSRIRYFRPVVATEAILKIGRKVAGVVLKGVSEERLETVKALADEKADPLLLTQKETPTDTATIPGVYIGRQLAKQLGLVAGDFLTFVSPTETEGPLSSVPRLKKFIVEGVYNLGDFEQELHTVWTRDSHVRSFLRRADVVTHWEVSISDLDDAQSVGKKLSDSLPNLKVEDWMQLNEHLFNSLRLERIAMFVILAFIVVVASFNIVTTLTLMVLGKKREISILKTMGAKNNQVAAIFLAEGLLIGIVGISLGIILSWTICIILKRYDFIELPDVYYDRSLPVTFDPLYYVMVSVAALVIVLYACLYPSRRAAKLDPLEGIRFG